MKIKNYSTAVSFLDSVKKNKHELVCEQSARVEEHVVFRECTLIHMSNVFFVKGFSFTSEVHTLWLFYCKSGVCPKTGVSGKHITLFGDGIEYCSLHTTDTVSVPAETIQKYVRA